MPERLRVFVDTSVIISGFASNTGASSVIRDLAEAGLIEMVVSEQVVIEADRNIGAKLPGLVGRFREFLKALGPEIAEEASAQMVHEVEAWMDRKDAPMMASAITAKVAYLVTLDAKDVMTEQTEKT